MATEKFLFFWGHTPKQPGVVGQECLSQWFPSLFEVDGVQFKTAEHYMMWGKAHLFGDAEAAERIIKANTPAEAKALGRSAVRGFDEETWVAKRLEIVTAGNVEKFRQNPDLLAFLLGTKNRTLVEASPRDRIWGIGMSASNELAQDRSQWRGLNLLGEALMRARATLLEAAEAAEADAGLKAAH